ncbi:MAG: DNA polymerase Y family protein, partial [Actinomycetota bacterium]
ADGVDLLRRSPNPLSTQAPWPGTIPAPSPALVFPDRTPVRLVGAADQALEVVNQRLSADAARLLVKEGGKWVSVTGWAGPWPVRERWWDKIAGRELARLQVNCSDDNAYLIAYEQGRWWLEARYD